MVGEVEMGVVSQELVTPTTAWVDEGIKDDYHLRG
jgi:hypothetical protein